MEDVCLICAEPLEWVGYGPCGHKEVCSVCVVRMRFVMKDNNCCICKQEMPAVFVTRHMGDYTETLSAAAFEQLPVCSATHCHIALYGIAWAMGEDID